MRPAYTVANAVRLLGAVSAAALAFAIVMQTAFGYPPCELCMIQRYWHGAVVLAALASLVVHRPRLWLTVQTAALLICCGYSIFHVGVEHGWWEGTAACGGARAADSLAALRAAIETAPVVRCGDVRWTFLGLSMAAYDALLTFAMAVFAIVTGARKR